MRKLQLLAFMLLTTAALWAQRAVTGTITDADGEALIGANIVLKGQSTVGTFTDIDGKFSLNVSAGYDVILMSYIGYSTQEITLGASNVMDIILQEGVEFDKLVVTDLGIEQEEKSLGYGVQEVSSNEVTQAQEDKIFNRKSTPL